MESPTSSSTMSALLPKGEGMTKPTTSAAIERGFEMYERVRRRHAEARPECHLYVGQMMRHLSRRRGARGAVVRDRRLVIMGVLAARQRRQVEIQFRRAHELGELSLDELEEIVLQLSPIAAGA